MVVIVSVVVAAVAVAAVMVRAPGRTDSALSATADTSTAPTNPFDNSSLTPPIALNLPSWTSHASASGWFGAVDFDVGSCASLGGQSPCAADQDLKLRLLSVTVYHPEDGSPVVSQDPSYAAHLIHLDGMAAVGIATITSRSPVTVGGRPATLVSLSVKRDAPGAIACAFASDQAADCASLVAGRTVRMAVVDQGTGKPPTVLYLSLNGDAPDRVERFAEFDAMLTTVKFG